VVDLQQQQQQQQQRIENTQRLIPANIIPLSILSNMSTKCIVTAMYGLLLQS
jgi:hypothetical protein